MANSRNEYLKEYAKNYTTARITFRKDSDAEMEILHYLKQKPDTSKFLKDLVRNEMEREARIERCLRLAGMRPLEELVGEIPGTYDVDDVKQKLDAMDSSREILPLDWNGMAQTWASGSPKFLKEIARPDFDGTAEWFGIAYCGKYEAVMHCEGYGWDDEEQMFLGESAEIIGWR